MSTVQKVFAALFAAGVLLFLLIVAACNVATMVSVRSNNAAILAAVHSLRVRPVDEVRHACGCVAGECKCCWECLCRKKHPRRPGELEPPTPDNGSQTGAKGEK